MKEIKTTQTIEVVTGYEAMDGTIFRSKEECEKYESSAKAAAKAAAWHYLVDDRISWEIFRDESQGLYIFDIPDAKALDVILRWAYLADVEKAERLTPDLIGKRIGVMWSEWDVPFVCKEYLTKEAMLEFYTKEIEALFADKTTDPQ
jgi:hypothetical protein